MTHVPDPPARTIGYRTLLWVASVVLLALSSVGCVSPSDFDKLQEEHRLALQSIKAAKHENGKLRVELGKQYQRLDRMEAKADELTRRLKAKGILPW